MAQVSSSLSIRSLIVPAGLEFLLVVRDVFSSRGRVEFHLQGLRDGTVVVHDMLAVDMDSIEHAGDLTTLLQNLIDEMHRRILVTKPGAG